MRSVAVMSGIGGISMIWLRQPVSLLIAATYSILILAYSHPRISLQSRGWLAPAVLAVCYGVLPLTLGLSQRALPFHPLLIVLGLVQFWTLMPLLLAKDYRDETGDRATGKRTPLVRYGYRAVMGAAMGFAAVGAGLLTTAGYAAGLHPALLASAAIAYLAFCYRLHARRGDIGEQERKLAGLMLLGLHLTILYELLLVPTPIS